MTAYRLLALLLVVLLAACGTAAPNAAPTTAAPAPDAGASSEEQSVTTPSGLQYTESQSGTGASPQPGDYVAVHYRGTLADGTVFDSSFERGEPIRFPLGRGVVIPGWDEGIGLMQAGATATLIIPPDLAYGAQGSPPQIPANATLTFEVELLDVWAGTPTTLTDADYTTTASGLEYHDLVQGDGATASTGQTVVVHYIGWLSDGTKFDSSMDRFEPFPFPLGGGRVIQGWDEGVAGMQIGGRRQLRIPANLAYGETGAGNGLIPPGATLIFEVELLDIQ